MTAPTPKRRWLHPTRLFIGLLVVQVFLLLSERFQWFAFNEKKGWTVLIAVGARYLQIRKGNPGVVAWGPAQLPHREDIKWPRRVEGVLETIFSVMYGIDHPKIVVETSNKKGYEVIYDPDDEKAMEVVADQLGMTVSKEEREILALRITVDEGGHKLKQDGKRNRSIPVCSTVTKRPPPKRSKTCAGTTFANAPVICYW